MCCYYCKQQLKELKSNKSCTGKWKKSNEDEEMNEGGDFEVDTSKWTKKK